MLPNVSVWYTNTANAYVCQNAQNQKRETNKNAGSTKLNIP